MDDATRLIADLEAKLVELDHKVTTYRQHLADEFTRHSDLLLRDIPESVSARVQVAVAESLANYPAISPALTVVAAQAVTTALSPAPAPAPTESGGAGDYRAESPHTTPKPPNVSGGSPVQSAPTAMTLTGAADSEPTGTISTTSTSTTSPTGTPTSPTSPTSPTPITSHPISLSEASHSADHEDTGSRFPRPPTPPPPPPPQQPQSTKQQAHPSFTRDSQGLGQMSHPDNDTPEDREADLRGVFTPTFLPLLDTNDNRLASPPPTPPRPRPETRDSFTTMALEGPIPDAGPSQSPPATASLPVRPPATRRATDDVSTASSILSDRSDAAKSRRSALRRSSSSSKPQSPRRVRFEVAGAEVLTTSSPSTSIQDFGVRQKEHDSSSHANAVLREEGRGPTASSDSILGFGNDDEPPPKKVSSSQALRALSKLPLDADTIWMPVTQDGDPEQTETSALLGPEQPTSTATVTARSAEKRPARLPSPPAQAMRHTLTRPPSRSNADRVRKMLGQPIGRVEQEEESDSSDGEFLSMSGRKTAKSSAASTKSTAHLASESRNIVRSGPRASPTAPDNAATPRKDVDSAPTTERAGGSGSTTAPAILTRDDGDFGGVFDNFEASEGMQRPRPATRPQEPDVDLDIEDADELGHREPLHMYSTSPAVNIPHTPQSRPAAHSRLGHAAASTAESEATPTNAAASTTPTTSTTKAPAATTTATATTTAITTTTSTRFRPTVGSYKGRSITMPVVVDPAVHARAAQLGNFNTFVGGLDGRTGLDDGDLNSFRASLTMGGGAMQFSGTPKSLTERMMLEEAMGLAGVDGDD